MPDSLDSEEAARRRPGALASAARGSADEDTVVDEHGNVIARRIHHPGENGPVVRDPEATRRAIAEFRERNKYPPTSQALQAGNVDLTRPNDRAETPTPSHEDANVLIIYTGNKLGVVGAESFDSYLQATKADQPTPVIVRSAVARVISQEGHEPLKLDYVERDGRWVNGFEPERMGLTTTATIETEIWFELPTGQAEDRVLRFAYTPQRAIPGRFTGKFRDAVEAGSLVIYAGIAIDVPGFYLVDCNLYGPDNQPVAWTRYKGELTRDNREVPLVFFGKLLRDQGVQPPFHIGQLRGVLRVEKREPSYDQIPIEDWQYRTQSRFTLADLSAAEWDSEHKRRMLEMMEKHGVKADPAGAN